MKWAPTIALLVLVACEPGQPRAAEAEPSATELLAANEPKVCADKDVLRSLRESIFETVLPKFSKEEMEIYLEAGGLTTNTVSAKDIDDRLHRITCRSKLMVAEYPEEISTLIEYTVSPSLAGGDNEAGFNVEWRIEQANSLEMTMAVAQDYYKRMKVGEAEETAATSAPAPERVTDEPEGSPDEYANIEANDTTVDEGELVPGE